MSGATPARFYGRLNAVALASVAVVFVIGAGCDADLGLHHLSGGREAWASVILFSGTGVMSAWSSLALWRRPGPPTVLQEVMLLIGLAAGLAGLLAVTWPLAQA